MFGQLIFIFYNISDDFYPIKFNLTRINSKLIKNWKKCFEISNKLFRVFGQFIFIFRILYNFSDEFDAIKSNLIRFNSIKND